VSGAGFSARRRLGRRLAPIAEQILDGASDLASYRLTAEEKVGDRNRKYDDGFQEDIVLRSASPSRKSLRLDQPAAAFFAMSHRYGYAPLPQRNLPIKDNDWSSLAVRSGWNLLMLF
jgi:hypothetical protein